MIIEYSTFFISGDKAFKNYFINRCIFYSLIFFLSSSRQSTPAWLCSATFLAMAARFSLAPRLFSLCYVYKIIIIQTSFCPI